MRNIYFDIDNFIIREFFRNARLSQFYQLDKQDLNKKIKQLEAILANI